MKKNFLTLVVGGLLLLIFAGLLFIFQVRETEVAVVTTFGRLTRQISEPGVGFKWPWPIQKVTKLDKRLQNFEGKFEETLTSDGRNLLALVYAGWGIADAGKFYNRFPNGSVAEAEKSLEGIIRSAKNAAIGRHPFADFIAIDPKALKLSEVEKEILDAVRQPALDNFGIDIRLLGFKRLGLPESVTEKVFDRMRAERKKEVERLQSEGQEQATRIRSTADLEKSKILAEADAQATRIRGEGDAEAAKSFAVFQQNPELALLILQLNALEATLKERTTLILDQNTPPFNLLHTAPPTEVQGTDLAR